MAVDVRLPVAVGAGWGALAVLHGVEGVLHPSSAIAFALAATALIVAWRLRRARGALTLVALSAVTSGLLLGAAAAREPPSLEGCTSFSMTIDEHGGAPSLATVDAADCRDRVVHDASVVVLGIVDVDEQPLDVGLGDHVRAECDAWMADAATWMLDCTEAQVTGSTWWAGWAHGARDAFRASTADLPGAGGRLLPGLTIGDTSTIDDALQRAMQAAGLTHLTAVSGERCRVPFRPMLWGEMSQNAWSEACCTHLSNLCASDSDPSHR